MWLSVLKSFLQLWLVFEYWMSLIVYLNFVQLVDLIWIMMSESSMLELLIVFWWNWNYMFNDWVISSYVIILVEMKSVCWRLKGNQGNMVTYVSICFNIIKLMCYLWWLIYMLICNHLGWNETNVMRVERESRYHG